MKFFGFAGVVFDYCRGDANREYWRVVDPRWVAKVIASLVSYSGSRRFVVSETVRRRFVYVLLFFNVLTVLAGVLFRAYAQNMDNQMVDTRLQIVQQDEKARRVANAQIIYLSMLDRKSHEPSCQSLRKMESTYGLDLSSLYDEMDAYQAHVELPYFRNLPESLGGEAPNYPQMVEVLCRRLDECQTRAAGDLE
ncbi:hypothetical protein [Rosistilla oblonga]|uniref:hypothetical protein n=1 Tax=Rosistilla oblonga TaxID=2527990 RepID=UPI003A97949C